MSETERGSEPPQQRIRAGLRAHEQARIDRRLPERFIPLRALGAGGAGEVLEVEDARLGRRVALKRLHVGSAGEDLGERLERLRIEAEAAARLNHAGIVTVHEFVQDGPTAFIVQELVAGGSLQERIDAEGPLAPAEVAALGRDLARALAAAHAEGVLHRDVKPSNVLLEGDALRPRLTDFGLAKLVDDGPGGLTSHGRVLGTPSYMAPELARGDLDRIGPRTDVFLLGATLYAALSGRAPFEGATLVNVLAAVQRCRPRPLSELGVDPALAAVVGRCMAAEPEQRYADAEAVARDLERWLAGERVVALPRTVSVVAAALAFGLSVTLVGVGLAPGARSEPAAAAPTPDRARHRELALTQAPTAMVLADDGVVRAAFRGVNEVVLLRRGGRIDRVDLRSGHRVDRWALEAADGEVVIRNGELAVRQGHIFATGSRTLYRITPPQHQVLSVRIPDVVSRRRAFAVAPHGPVGIGGGDGVVRLFARDMDVNARRRAGPALERPPRAMAFAAKGRLLVVSTRNQVRVIELQSKLHLPPLETPATVTHIAAKGARAILGDGRGSLRRLHLQPARWAGALKLEARARSGEPGPVGSLQWVGDEVYALFRPPGRAPTLRVWSERSEVCAYAAELPAHVTEVEVAADGRLLLWGGGRVEVWARSRWRP